MAQMNLTPLDDVLDKHFGKVGTPKRDAFESDVDEALHAYRLGEAIKKARLEQNLTQEQLGERIGVKRAQISRLEKGYSITIPTMRRVFKALGVKIGGGIGTAVVGWMLEFSGYVGTNATQPQSALDMMQFMYLWLPLIFDVLIMFVLSRMNVEDANKKLKAEKGIAADEVTDALDIN